LQVDASIPLFGFIGRLEEQKGVDILLHCLPGVAEGGGLQVVMLGTGKKVLEEAVLDLDQRFPHAVKGVVKFDTALAHLITAGACSCSPPPCFQNDCPLNAGLNLNQCYPGAVEGLGQIRHLITAGAYLCFFLLTRLTPSQIQPPT